jgi:hypothetical protein
LDAITGCHGIPLGHITLLSGRITSGKATVAYMALANAQHAGNVAILDLAHNCDPDYMHGCGIDLAHLFLVRPNPGVGAVDLLLDLVRSRQLCAIVVNGLADLTYQRSAYQRFNAAVSPLAQLLRSTACALIFLDDPSPIWLRWLNWDRSWAIRQRAALHIEMRFEQDLGVSRQHTHHAVSAHTLHSRWPHKESEAMVEIAINGDILIGPYDYSQRRHR